MSNYKIKEKLTNKMEELSLSVPEISKLSGLPESSIKNILQGKSQNPRIDTVEGLCKAFSCNINTLLDDVIGTDKSQSKKPANEKKQEDNTLLDFYKEYWNCDLYITISQYINSVLLERPNNADRKRILDTIDEIYYNSARSYKTKPAKDIKMNKEFADLLLEIKLGVRM